MPVVTTARYVALAAIPPRSSGGHGRGCDRSGHVWGGTVRAGVGTLRAGRTSTGRRPEAGGHRDGGTWDLRRAPAPVAGGRAGPRPGGGRLRQPLGPGGGRRPRHGVAP